MKNILIFLLKNIKKTIPPNSKGSNSAFAFSRDTGNLEEEAVSSLSGYQMLQKIEESDVREDIDKIGKIIIYLKNNKKMISYLALLTLLQSYKLSFNIIQMIKILKFLHIKSPNAFSLNDFIYKISKYKMNSTSFNFRPKSSFNLKRNFGVNKSNRINRPSSCRYRTNSNAISQEVNKDNGPYFDFEQNEPQNASSNNIPNKNINNFKSCSIEKYKEIDIKAIRLIRDRIYQRGTQIDEISRYFDHLLSYNICRKDNIIYPDELERLMQLEQYDFSPEEIQSIFNYIDTLYDGFIDRMEFISVMKSVPHPISTIINYIKKRNLSIADIAYKMGYDIYNCVLETTLSNRLD